MILRVDDYPTGVRPLRPDRVKEFLEFHSELGGVPYFLGVVPFLCDEGDWGLLRELESDGVIIAMHGFYHGVGADGSENEFAGISRFALRQWMMRAMHLFDENGIARPRIFIPPWNRVTHDLVNVLDEYDFETVCLGPESAGVDVRPLDVLWSMPPAYGRSKEIVEIFDRLDKDVCVTLHWTWERDDLEADGETALPRLAERMRNVPVSSWVSKEPVLVSNTIVLNEEESIGWALSSVYPLVDRCIIVEGSTQYAPLTTDEGLSIDRTAEIIRSFPDPEGKIEFYQVGRMKNKNELREEVLKHMNEGEWVLMTDADEIWNAPEIRFLRRYIRQNPDVVEIFNGWIEFAVDMRHTRPLVRNGEFSFVDKNGVILGNGLIQERIYKYFEGYNYKNSHVVVQDKDGKPIYGSPEYASKRVALQDHVKLYHMGHMKSVSKQFEHFFHHHLQNFAPDKKPEDFTLEEKRAFVDKYTPDGYKLPRDYKDIPPGVVPYRGAIPCILQMHQNRWLHVLDIPDVPCYREWIEKGGS